jgi:uncharacterized protein DUF3810
MESAGLARGLRWRIGVVVGAAIAALTPVPPALVDRFYSAGVYPPLQRILTAASNSTPIPVLDILIVLAGAGFVALAWRDARAPAGLARAFVRLLVRGVVVGSVTYLVFMCAWGFNYRRVPIIEALPFETGRVSADAAQRAAATAVERVNALHDAAHAAGWPSADAIDERLADGLRRAVRELERGASIVPARPKKTLLDWYFRRAGVDGMTDPIFLETLIATDVLPFERPFVVAHEWSHLAGFADEGDANFVGWLACLRSSPSAQYSGWLFLYSQIAQSIGGRAAAPIAERLAEGPRADLRAIRERIARHVNPRVAAVGWRAYDAYLKANRIEAGTNSYAEVVRLALGVRLPSGAPAFPVHP